MRPYRGRRRGAGEHPLLLQLIEVAAHCRFRYRKLLGQFRQCRESSDADQFQQVISTLFGQHGVFWERQGIYPSRFQISHM